MHKDDYISSQAVKEFILWVEPILSTPQSFIHTYNHKKNKKVYKFDNLFSAYEKYDWDWKHTIEELSDILLNTIIESDEKSCENACYMILKWGGVKTKVTKIGLPS